MPIQISEYYAIRFAKKCFDLIDSGIYKLYVLQRNNTVIVTDELEPGEEEDIIATVERDKDDE